MNIHSIISTYKATYLCTVLVAVQRFAASLLLQANAVLARAWLAQRGLGFDGHGTDESSVLASHNHDI